MVIFTTFGGPELLPKHDKYNYTINALRSFDALEVAWMVVLVVDDVNLCKRERLVALQLSKTTCIQNVLQPEFHRPTIKFLLKAMERRSS